VGAPSRRSLLLGASALLAGALPVPLARAVTEPVVLEVNGRVPASRRFTLADLAALGAAHVRTSTLWTDGVHDFEGVLARKVIEAAGAKSSRNVIARGLNDYTATIPLSDFLDYDVILAWSMDGVPLTRRDKGPLWIVYPRDAHAELADERLEHRWVWQLAWLTLP